LINDFSAFLGHIFFGEFVKFFDRITPIVQQRIQWQGIFNGGGWPAIWGWSLFIAILCSRVGVIPKIFWKIVDYPVTRWSILGLLFLLFLFKRSMWPTFCCVIGVTIPILAVKTWMFCELNRPHRPPGANIGLGIAILVLPAISFVGACVGWKIGKIRS